MSIYVIGDLHGCLDELLLLLDKIKFNRSLDKLWFVGDYVNVGLKSIETLKFIMNLGKIATCILGNHEIAFLAKFYGVKNNNLSDSYFYYIKKKDLIDIVDWIRHLPLYYHSEEHNALMVHAGMHPYWTLESLCFLSEVLENILKSASILNLLNILYCNSYDTHSVTGGKVNPQFNTNINPFAQSKYVLNCLTKIRFCTNSGDLDFKNKGSVSGSYKFLPWFDIQDVKALNLKIIFGHWSSLKGITYNNAAVAIDTGCVFGGRLTALRLTDGKRFYVDKIRI